MQTAIFLVAFLATAQPDPAKREPHPLAPSLPRLTKEEYERIDAVIERFIQADIGKLKGAEAKQAVADFNKLGPEAIFNLIDGLNRAANMESSCPAVIIAKRVGGVLGATDDMELLIFAKDNIGAGVEAKRHVNVLKDLQFNILLRKNTLQKRAARVAGMSIDELEKAIARERGPQLRPYLTEAEKRKDARAVDLLLTGIANTDPQIAKLSQGLLAKNLQRQSPDVLKTMLKHERREVRLAAVQAAGAKKLRLGKELIGLLQDSDAEVARAANRALVQISGGADYGSDVERWREWWSKQK
jgi:hypothetical protein